MICQICKKNPATVHVQEIIGGKKSTLHLCASCADKKAMLEPFLHGTDLEAIIKDMMGMIKEGQEDAEEAHDHEHEDHKRRVVCPFCLWTLEQWNKTGRLGCERCYTVFASEIDGQLPAMHRGIVHKGKMPPELESQEQTAAEQVEEELALIRDLESLRKDLQGSIRREEYEIAAKIRDKIADLEQLLAEKGLKI